MMMTRLDQYNYSFEISSQDKGLYGTLSVHASSRTTGHRRHHQPGFVTQLGKRDRCGDTTVTVAINGGAISIGVSNTVTATTRSDGDTHEDTIQDFFKTDHPTKIAEASKFFIEKNEVGRLALKSVLLKAHSGSKTGLPEDEK